MEVRWELSHGSYVWGARYWLEGLRWDWWLCSSTASSSAASSAAASSSTASSDCASEGSVKGIVDLLSRYWKGCWLRSWLRWRRLGGSGGWGGCRGHGWCRIGWGNCCSNSRRCTRGKYSCPTERTVSYLEV